MNLKPLQKLIDLAMQDETFNAKYTYWTVIRKRQPTSDWLFNLLIDALGEEAMQTHMNEVSDV